MSKSVLRLADANEKSLVGGKAWSLHQLLQANFNVPPGFVVSAAANHHMTSQLQRQIWQMYNKLGASFVAVRSSAIAEDGQIDAWAGQLDTFLNVQWADLPSAIERCWQSINSERARAYAAQKHLSTSPVAVVVQAMIQSQTSGVAFSVHPVTQATNQIVIEAGWGIGEAIVSGQITPDTYVITKANQSIQQKHLSSQTKKLVQLPHGDTDWAQITTNTNSQKLSDRYIKQLSQLVIQLESLYNHPVDVEWALADNQLYILQSRPVTSLS